METIGLTPVVLNIVGALCLFAAAMAFAVGAVTSAVALDWYPDRKPSALNRCMGYLFGIRNYTDVLKVYTGGTYDEIRKRSDVNAPARGVVWTFLGTVVVIIAQLI
jgi:hypothetical protein